MCLRRAHLLVGQHHAGAVRQAGDHLAGLAAAPARRIVCALDARCWASIWRRSSSVRSPTSSRPSTNRRRPSCVGSRPAEVCGAYDQPQLLQVRHDVADRGRRQRHRQRARQVARADRLAGGEIGLDDLPEDGARALVELGELAYAFGHRSGYVRTSPVKLLKIRDARAVFVKLAGAFSVEARRAAPVGSAANLPQQQSGPAPLMRPSKRKPDELRRVSIERAVSMHAEGSCLIKFGNTHVCARRAWKSACRPGSRARGAAG